MTKEDFIRGQRRLNHISTTRGVVWLVLFFGTLIGGAISAKYVEQRPELGWLTTVLAVTLCVVLFGGSGLFLWSMYRHQRRYGHRCPSCQKALVSFTAQIAIATGHCGYCGGKVFEEE